MYLIMYYIVDIRPDALKLTGGMGHGRHRKGVP